MTGLTQAELDRIEEIRAWAAKVRKDAPVGHPALSACAAIDSLLQLLDHRQADNAAISENCDAAQTALKSIADTLGRYFEVGGEDSVVVQYVIEAKREIDRLREDGTRLDAYERMARNGIKPGVLFDSTDGFQGWEWGNHPLFDSLRDAIDAAMKEGSDA